MLRAALLDMYNGESNRGIPMLRSILGRYSESLTFDHFDVRAKNEIPDLSYDIYIFSGGPGNPLLDDGDWFERFHDLLDDVWEWNLYNTEAAPKHCFFICHSFQMMCDHFDLGEVSQRYKMSFGTYPVHKTYWGKEEPLFQDLHDPFYIADFRRYQVTKPNQERLKSMGAHILCLEKLRPHVHFERAIMGIRFSPTMVGTQFHPEADPDGLLSYFMEDERRHSIIEEHGKARYNRMINDLSNPQKIQLTFETIIPQFLDRAVKELSHVLMAC
ncbi:MAG TPA: GMP synthase [Saprospiraceae bacterium]|nr:GMP synthase [Saprospiraceae bacterium]HND87072.1 GMP synthase [Saprospiraceae bacterium]